MLRRHLFPRRPAVARTSSEEPARRPPEAEARHAQRLPSVPRNVDNVAEGPGERAHPQMGRHSYGWPEVIAFRGDTARCSIGAFCSIAPEVQIQVGGNHHTHTVSTFPFRLRWRLPNALADGMPSSKGDVIIANDVWIGQGAMILSGVSIGDGAVIGARAVVATDVRAYAVVVGNPAREVRRRFSDAVVEELLAIRWWEWPDDVLKERIDFLNRLPVEAFVERFRAQRTSVL